MPTATAWHGPQGGIVDLRGVLVQKGSSLGSSPLERELLEVRVKFSHFCQVIECGVGSPIEDSRTETLKLILCKTTHFLSTNLT